MIFKQMYKKALFIALSALLCACSNEQPLPNPSQLSPEQFKKLDDLKDGVKERSENRQQRREAVKKGYEESGADEPEEYIEQKKQDNIDQKKQDIEDSSPEVDMAIPSALEERIIEKPDLSTDNILQDPPFLDEVEVSSNMSLESKIEELELPAPEEIDLEEVKERVTSKINDLDSKVKNIQPKRTSTPNRPRN